MKSSTEKIKQEAERLLAEPAAQFHRMFGEELEISVRENKALQRRREVRSAKDLLHLVLVYALKDWSLNMLGAWAYTAGIGYLSDVALLKRLRNCRKWLGHLLYHCLQKRRVGLATEAGVRICLRDASVVNAPGSWGTDWRLHLKLDLSKSMVQDVAVTDSKTGEGLANLDIQPDEIHIADRAYGLVSGIGVVLSKFAHVILRLNHQNLPLWKNEDLRFDIYAWLRDLTAPAEQPVLVKTPLGHFPMRVLACPLPPDKAGKARRKVRENARKKKYQPSENSLLAAGFLLLITDLPHTRWPLSCILGLYRLRWQIEMQFKTYKSLMQLDHLRSHDPDVACTYLLAKLLLVLLLDELTGVVRDQQPDWFSDLQHPVSQWQLVRTFQSYLEHILLPARSFAQFWLVLPALQRYFRIAPRRRCYQLAWTRAFLEHLSVSASATPLS